MRIKGWKAELKTTGKVTEVSRKYGIKEYGTETNIELGARILYENFQRFGNWVMAVKAYNGLEANNWDYVKSVFEKISYFR